MRFWTLGLAGILSLHLIAPSTVAADGTAATTQAELHDASDDLAPLLKKYKLPGIAVVALTRDEIIASGVAGVRKHGTDVSISIHDQFHIGSCTKAMTATLCGVLVEEGKLDWDSTIEHVFPELIGKIDDAYYKVTLEQLLTHHSGCATLPARPVKRATHG